MPTASTLESRSYLVSGSAELDIKICIHKPKHFTESKLSFLLYSWGNGGTKNMPYLRSHEEPVIEPTVDFSSLLNMKL